MALKQIDQFLRFITMGAAGGAAVSHDLREHHGHRTIELERYAMANKLWATKLKRLRLADLLCLDCGLRVEARAKSDLKVRMSHSKTSGREWDAGLRDRDLCAFVPWNGQSPGRPEYFDVKAMRETADLATHGQPKAASEGAESDMTWATRTAKREEVVEDIDYEEGKVALRATEAGGRRRTVQLRNVPAHIYVSQGEVVPPHERFIMGCLARPGSLECPGQTWDYIADINALENIDRYAAVKAAGLRGGKGAEPQLLGRFQDEEEDERIRLEALASLARLDPETYLPMLVDRAQVKSDGDKHEMAWVMEAIFAITELGSSESGEALAMLAEHETLDSEARCACVWGLGVTGLNAPELLLPFIADDDEEVALHALAGIGELPDALFSQLERMLAGTDSEAASAADLLSMSGDKGIERLLSVADGGLGPLWAIAALGEIPEADVRRVADNNISGRLEPMLLPQWTGQRSWLRAHQIATPVQVLKEQTVRHLA